MAYSETSMSDWARDIPNTPANQVGIDNVSVAVVENGANDRST